MHSIWAKKCFWESVARKITVSVQKQTLVLTGYYSQFVNWIFIWQWDGLLLYCVFLLLRIITQIQKWIYKVELKEDRYLWESLVHEID